MQTTAADRQSFRTPAYVPASCMRVLDCACGVGKRAAALRAVPGRWIAGVERDPGLAEQARGLLDEVICGDQYALRLPWDDGHFDCALGEGLLERMRDPAPFLREVVRVLGPKGLFVAAVPNIQYHANFLMLARGRWEQGGTGALALENIRFFTAHSLAQLMVTAGLDQVRVGVLDTDEPSAFPIDHTGHVVLGDLRIGPMSPDHHRLFLARSYIVLGTKPA